MLFLIPLFLVLGIMYAFISYELQTKELKWAVDQESRALGHTIQSFVEHNSQRYFEFNPDSLIRNTVEFEVILQRILSQERMVRINVSDSDSNPILTLAKTDYPYAVPDSASSESLYNSDFEGTRYSFVKYEDHAVLNVNTMLETEFGSISVNMVKDAEPYNEKIRELRKWIGLEILIAIILGFLVSMILTYFIKIRITKLATSARYFLKGEEKVNLEQGTISEFNDLGSTLNILVNVFHKNMDWYRKSIQQKEQDRTSLQLSHFVKSLTSDPVKFKKYGLTVTAAIAGTDNQNLFLAKSKSSENEILWGTVNETDPIETALLTEAITNFISEYADPNQDLIELIRSVFGNQILELNWLQVTETGIVRISKFRDSLVNEYNIDLNSNQTTWIHSLDDTITEKIDMYTKHSSSLSHDQLFSDVRVLTGHIESTVLIGISKNE